MPDMICGCIIIIFEQMYNYILMAGLLFRWMQVDHHSSHAALGFWDGVRELNIQRPLILSYDGGGNDGITLAFAGSAEEGSDPLTPVRNTLILELFVVNIFLCSCHFSFCSCNYNLFSFITVKT